MKENQSKRNQEIPLLKVLVEEERGKTSEFQFRKNFRIGRHENCEIQIESADVSRNHAEVFFSKGRWWIKDLNSTNGIFVGAEQVKKIPLRKLTKVDLGRSQISLIFTIEGSSSEALTLQDEPPSVTQYVQHYFDPAPDKEAGEHTKMIRGAYQVVQKKQRKKYYMIIAGVAFIALSFGIYSYIKHQQVERQKQIAEQIFYTMKSLELELGRLRDIASNEKNEDALMELERTRRRELELSKNYEEFLEQLHFYEDSKWNEQDKMIIQVARLFGECELGIPQDFLDEVYRYINKWKTTDRLENALLRAVQNGYSNLTAEIMLENHLPPQFFYLALQESDFKIKTIGPETRFGIAKGIWQFIPATASRYGLTTGPLVGLRRYDPKDERFDFEKSTRAAAKYIKDIYNTEAQASGLLVIASYNWGERKVRELIRRMPENPQNRNFWELFKVHRTEIPRETYNYVFYIISASVIGENPELFGFAFENPLGFLAEASMKE